MNHLNHFLEDPGLRLNRRTFFARTSLGLGSMALASLLAEPAGAGEGATDVARPGSPTIDRPIAGFSPSLIMLPRLRESFICS